MCGAIADKSEHFVEFYEDLVDWPKRLANEEPFYRKLFEEDSVKRVLDVACGPGHHVAMFHSWGIEVEGADLNPAMIKRSRELHGESETLRWVVRSYDEGCDRPGKYDAVICVGNSLRIDDDATQFLLAVRTMIEALRPGGVCVVQVLNLWHIPEGPTVWKTCKRIRRDGVDRVLLKGIHRIGSQAHIELVELHVSQDTFEKQFDARSFRGITEADLVGAAQEAGAEEIQCLGDFHGGSFNRNDSTDLILLCRRPV